MKRDSAPDRHGGRAETVRVNGYRDIPVLVTALRVHAEKVSQEARKVA